MIEDRAARIVRFHCHAEPAFSTLINRLRFGMAILNRFSAVLPYCDSTYFCASRCGNSGDFRLAILELVDLRFAILCH